MLVKNTVLILDDDPIVLKSLSKFLEKENISVITASSFKEALKKYLQNKDKIDLVLVDYILPDAPEGRAIDYFISHNVPTILLTATYEPKIRELYVKKGLVDYIFKTIPDALKITVNTVKRILKNKKIKVLIIDDAVTDRKALEKFMKNSLFKVFSVESIKESEKLIEKNPDIKVILLDYNLPDEDPLQFINKIRKKYPKEKLAIFVISGYISDDLSPILLKSGVNEILRKPFYREELTNRVFNLLDMMEKYEELENIAYKDFLTDLYNRRFFLEEAKKILGVARRNNLDVAFILFDIDKFKSINDTYGHDVGDLVLKDFSEKLRKYFHREADLIARMGGEEFAILSIYENFENLKKHLIDFLKFVKNNPVTIPSLNKNIHYTVSGGVATGNNHTIEELYKIADKKLYEAKNTGRAKIIF